MTRGVWRVAVVGLAAALGGCMTTQEALTMPPTLAYVSDAAPAVVRDCILHRGERVKDWLNVPVPPPQVAELSGVTKINFMADARMFVELRPAGAGTDVRYTRHVRKVGAAGAYDEVIASCRTPNLSPSAPS